MLQSKGNNPVEAPASQFIESINETILKFDDDFTQADLIGEFLEAYQVVVTSKEYSDIALSNLLYSINRTLSYTAELTRIRNNFFNDLHQAKG